MAASNGITFDLMDMLPSQRPKHKRNKSSVLKALVSPIGHKRNASENNFYEENDDTGAGKQNNITRALIPPLQRYYSDDLFLRPTTATKVQGHMMLTSDKNGGNISKPMNVAIQARGEADCVRGKEVHEDWRYGNGGTVKDKENSTPPSSAAVSDTAQSPIFSQFTSTKLMEISATSMSDISRRALKAGNGNAGKPSLGETRNGDQYQHRHGNTGIPARRPLSVASAQTIHCPAKSDSRANQSPTRLSRDVRLPNQEPKENLDSVAVDMAFEKVLVCSYATMLFSFGKFIAVLTSFLGC